MNSIGSKKAYFFTKSFPVILGEEKYLPSETLPSNKLFSKKHNKATAKKNSNCKGVSEYLSMVVIRKTIKNFLTEKEMSRENLAQLLKITTEELDQLLFYRPATELIRKANLSLIKLYCATKFDNQNNQ